MPGFVMSSRSRCNYAMAIECQLTNASCVIQEGYIVPTNTNVEPATRGTSQTD
jgi:hypothetical protein